MRKFTWKTLVLSAVAAFTLGSTPAQADDFWWDLFSTRSDTIQFTASAEYLTMTRDADINTGLSVIGGPDASGLSLDNADFGYEQGYRTSIGFQTPEQRVEVIFAEYGDWTSQATGSLTAGLAFDSGIGTSWAAGFNFLDTTTFFTPINAASASALGGEGDEHDGLGPNAAFTDTLPTYNAYYRSSMQDLEVNLLSNDPHAEIRIGIGYRNVQLDEQSGISISGTYRATNIAAANGGLTDASLTGAGLSFISGTANGFQDGTIGGTPDTLTLSWQGDTGNDLNGFQVLVDACLVDTGRFDITTFVKAGAYHNHANGRVVERYTGVGDDTSVYGRSFTDSKDSVAFVGGVAVQGRMALTDYLSVIAGYEGTFVSGVALGPEQASSVRGTSYEVNTDGNVITHGGTVGLELLY